MRNWKRGTGAALAAALAVSLLAGCGDKSGDAQNSGNDTQNGGGTQAEEFVYVPQYIPIKGELNGYVGNVTYANGALYATSWGVIGTRMVERPVSDSDVIAYATASSVPPLPGAGGTPAEEEDAEGETELVEEEIWGEMLYKISLDGTATKIPYAPEELDTEDGKNGSVSTDYISVADDGTIYILERAYVYWYDAPEGVSRYDNDYYQYYHNEQHYTLVALADDGTVLSRAPLEQFTSRSDGNSRSEDIYLNNFTTDGAGNAYFSVQRYTETSGSETMILVMDKDGKELLNLPMDNYVETLVRLPDGGVAAAYYGDGGELIAEIDLEKQALGEGTRVNGDLYQMTAGGGDYDLYYTSGVSFYGYDLESGERTKLLSWINCDVDADNLSRAFVLDDGRIVAVTSEYDTAAEGYDSELVIVAKAPANSVPRKQVITLSTQSLDWSMRGAIIKFNKGSDLYRIEVRDYSEYNTEDDYEAGLTKLRTELLSGNVPDLLDLSGLPTGQLASRGYLEDLWPYIDGDAELSRAGLMEHVLQAFETDGKLYQTVPGFAVNTAVGATAVVGDRSSWTVDEFQAALRRLRELSPEATAFNKYTTRSSILQTCLYLDMDNFVNWSTGQCDFDSPEFVKLLEFANSFPSEFDWENYEWSEDDNSWMRLMSGLQMAETAYVSDFTDFQMYDALFNGAYTCVGYPTSFGSGNMFVATGSGFALSTKCADKDAAWQFLRQFFTESYQSGGYYGFPTNVKAYEKKLKDAMTPEYQTDENGNYILDEDGNKIEMSRGGVGFGDTMIEFHAVTQDEADRIQALIDGTTKVLEYDQNIYDIVQEQTAPFFDGQRSAGDVAKLVQSKVSIYVNEQR